MTARAGCKHNTSASSKWTEWAKKNVTPATVRALHETANAFDTWYVYFGCIDPATIEACVDMNTGLAVEGWRDTPKGIVRSVPPERRHKWHNNLMKQLRRRYSVAGKAAA